MRANEFQVRNLQTGRFEEFGAVVFIKDMVMKAAVLKIPQRSLPELLRRPGARVARHIMECQNLFQMRRIGLIDSSVVIFHHMADGGWFAAMVKCMSVIGK
jgi:hypothetical protein